MASVDFLTYLVGYLIDSENNLNSDVNVNIRREIEKKIGILHHQGKIRHLESSTLVNQSFIEYQSYNKKGEKIFKM